MFATICNLIPQDGDYSARTRRLDILSRILAGTFYDNLPFEFHQERDADGTYIPLRHRRPSVRYALPRLVVEDSVALLFSDGHFPIIDSDDAAVRAAMAAIVKDTRLNTVMTEAALRGSVGSVVLMLRILKQRVFVDVLDTLFLTPVWDPAEPDCLLRLTERYKVSGRDLLAQGYDGVEAEGSYWFSRGWDAQDETWYLPVRVGDARPPAVDAQRSVRHALGFVPAVWIKNLPGGSGVDGACTFAAAIDASIEIDYQLSQAGRGLKYSSDPTLLIKEPANGEGMAVRGAANALVVSEKGDARLLEIGGTASQAVIEYVRTLREFALESVHGNRVDASRITVPASGRALEMMNQGLLWLSDNLRTSFGESGLLVMARMILRASNIYPLRALGAPVPVLPINVGLGLRWPDWYPADASDRYQEAKTVSTLVEAGHLSRETGTRIVAPRYGLDDVGAELQRISAEKERDGGC